MRKKTLTKKRKRLDLMEASSTVAQCAQVCLILNLVRKASSYGLTRTTTSENSNSENDTGTAGESIQMAAATRASIKMINRRGKAPGSGLMVNDTTANGRTESTTDRAARSLAMARSTRVAGKMVSLME